MRTLGGSPNTSGTLEHSDDAGERFLVEAATDLQRIRCGTRPRSFANRSSDCPLLPCAQDAARLVLGPLTSVCHAGAHDRSNQMRAAGSISVRLRLEQSSLTLLHASVPVRRSRCWCDRPFVG